MYFRSFFAYFDETKCRWDKEKNSCDDFVEFSGSTDSGTDSETDSGTGDDDDSNTDTNVVNGTPHVTDATDVTIDTNTDLTNDTTTKPSYQNLQCEPLDETWICSSGSRNHSLCIKFCTVGKDIYSTPVVGRKRRS